MNSFDSRAVLTSGSRKYTLYRLPALAARGFNLSRLPFSLKILLENLLRREDGVNVTAADIEFLAKWDPKAEPSREIAYMPARVLMQDFTGVPRSSISAPCATPSRSWAAIRSASIRWFPPNWSSTTPCRWTSTAPQAPIPPTRCSNSSATASAMPFSSGASRPSATSPPCRRAWASATRSISNTWPAWSSPRRSTAKRLPIPTRWSAPTRTPP